MPMIQGWRAPKPDRFHDAELERQRIAVVLQALNKNGNDAVRWVLILSYMKHHLELEVNTDFMLDVYDLHKDHLPKTHHLNHHVKEIELALAKDDWCLDIDDYPKFIADCAVTEAMRMGLMEKDEHFKKKETKVSVPITGKAPPKLSVVQTEVKGKAKPKAEPTPSVTWTQAL